MPTYAERRLLPHSPEQMFAIVADVERYPAFLPWCQGARVWRGGDQAVFEAELMIGSKMIRERFRSKIQLKANESITVNHICGPFAHLNNRWRFIPADKGCLVDFFIDYECTPGLLQIAITAMFGEAARQIMTAFETRAKTLYLGSARFGNPG